MNEERLEVERERSNLEDLKTVNSNMSAMEGQLQKVSNEFSTLQDEMKKNLLDSKKNTIILNARQTLMMLQNEYDKKYSHRDYIRRKVIGILQAGDLNTVRKETMESIGEEALINNPDYWLAPALLSLCAWYNDKKDIANKALIEALHRNSEMTSLLLCFIHLRSGRINTATKWLNKYLDMQIPNEIDSKISLIIDAITSGIFPYTMQSIVINKLDKWLNELNNYNLYQDIYQKVLSLWIEHLSHIRINVPNIQFGYIETYIKDGKEKLDFISNVNNIKSINANIISNLEINERVEDAYTDKIDKIITRLIFSHDDNEERLKDEMFKNQCLIDSYGDDVKANEVYSKNKEYIKNYNDLYTHLTRIAIYDDKVNQNSKKLSMSLLKYFIVTAYKEVINYNNIAKDESKEIIIENINMTTTDGSNEEELINILNQEKDKIYLDYIKNNKLINISNYLSIIGLVLSIILLIKYPIIGLIVLLFFIGYNAITILKKLKQRSDKKKEVEIIKKEYRVLLLNIIAEVVDYHFILDDIKEETDEFINTINSLKPQDYLQKDLENKHRNIEIGDKNE